MKNSYGFYELFRISLSLIYTKIFFSKARLLRLPIYIRGKKHFDFKPGFTAGYGCRIECFDVLSSRSHTLRIGLNCQIGDYVHIASGESVTIGNNCLLASKIYISDISHGVYSGAGTHSSPSELARDRILHTSPVSIGDNVWIGESVSILPGVQIGDNCIIGANSVVNKSIPDNCIAVGAPARIIKKYDFNSEQWVVY